MVCVRSISVNDSHELEVGTVVFPSVRVRFDDRFFRFRKLSSVAVVVESEFVLLLPLSTR